MRLPALLTLAVVIALASGCGNPAGGDGATAATTRSGPSANLWVDADGGSCSRAGVAAPYDGGRACRSIDAAWDRCRPGDTIMLRPGVYGPQRITGDRAAPGCSVDGGGAATIGELTTDGDFFSLAGVTVDVGSERQAGWRVRADHVHLRDVLLHGPFVTVDINESSDVSWVRGELGVAGRMGGKRVCGRDAEPVQIGDSDHVVLDGIRFHPQDADPTPDACSANGFHLEMVRIDGGTSFLTLRNSIFENGDMSGTASVFVTEPGGDVDPHDLTFQNNVFGTNDAIGVFDVHANVTPCRNFTFAYNTFGAPLGAFQCESAVGVRWIGNLGARSAGDCLGTYKLNVWQDSGRDACGSDRWVRGTPSKTDRLGLGGKGGFHLQPGSPAIDAGEHVGYCTTRLRSRDVDGDRRPAGSRCDAGADERPRRGR